jgi:uncharacterized small protein (DUF1192 family)
MRVRLTQGPSGNQAQNQHLDLSSAENIADSIALLREENDRLRKMAASLSMETEDIRRSLSPPAASLVAASHLKSFLGLS